MKHKSQDLLNNDDGYNVCMGVERNVLNSCDMVQCREYQNVATVNGIFLHLSTNADQGRES